MNEITTDICIVGAGPAGLALALLLARSGARVVVMERSRSTAREYRGEILQPGGLAVLDELGVLAGVRALGSRELSGFRLQDGGRVLLDVDYRRLPPPHNHLLAVPQPHVLAELLAACRRCEGFTLLPGHRVSALHTDADGRVTGAVGTADGEAVSVRSRVVVGADGRYSKTRALAGIAAGREDVFAQDVLWFRLHAPDRLTGRVSIHRGEGAAAIVHDSHPDRLQIGWTLPHGGYRELVAEGHGRVLQRLCRDLPEYADLIGEQLTRPSDLKLLDVFAGCAERWAHDGLLLVGDAAHTHGPLGAQGINLALQDAALAHPVLMAAWREGRSSAADLDAFHRERGPDIDAVMRMQRMQSRGMFERNKAADVLRPIASRLISLTPIGRKMTRRIAFGDPRIHVHCEFFTGTY